MCACGCGQVGDIWDDLCLHCNNQIISEHESEDVQGCCNVCAEGMLTMTRLFEEIEDGEELAKAFDANVADLKKMPKETFVQYETEKEIPSSSSARQNTMKVIEKAVISIPALCDFFHNYGNNNVEYKNDRTRKKDRTDFLITMIRGHDEYRGNKEK
jgi:hypothetical protein